jgi:hypothetical protein
MYLIPNNLNSSLISMAKFNESISWWPSTREQSDYLEAEKGALIRDWGHSCYIMFS